MPFSLRSLWLSALAAFFPLALGAAVETWATPSGAPLQAECLGVKGDYVVFKKADGSRVMLPFAKLSPSDQARAAAVNYTAPGAVITIAKEETSADSSKIAVALRGKIVALNGRALRVVSSEELGGTHFYAVYFSASWCGPCRRFTPQLVAAYPKIKAAHPEFEVIFVSNDQDEDSMRRYMIDDHMPWVALRYRDIPTTATLLRYQGTGIPNLVFIDGNGLILSQSYERGQYVGPQKVLKDIQRHFKM